MKIIYAFITNLVTEFFYKQREEVSQQATKNMLLVLGESQQGKKLKNK